MENFRIKIAKASKHEIDEDKLIIYYDSNENSEDSDDEEKHSRKKQ